jgi:hypothetical protein
MVLAPGRLMKLVDWLGVGSAEKEIRHEASGKPLATVGVV